MSEMYKACIKANKRIITAEVDITLKRAIDFLTETKHGIILDSSGKEYTKEELENVKSVRSLPGIGADSIPSSGSEVYEDSYRELFESIGDNPEPSPERDN